VHDRLGRVFSALADPRRRFVVEALATRGGLTPSELAAELPVTRQAVSKHLAALRAAGLVRPARSGREVRYELEPEPLGDAVGWIQEVGAVWDERLAALARHVAGQAGAR
jgi:DNA-binding transcriptional ArsR family regulator